MLVTNDMIRMMELAAKRFHCSQILLCMGLEAQGKNNPDVIRAVNGLAGGMGFSGDVCGTLTGGACLLGLYAGRGAPEEEEDPRLNLMVSELVEWFSKEFGEKYGGIQCRVILDDDPNNQKTRCPAMVMKVYEKAKSLLVENGLDLSAARS
jgi:C_GCAxxG_C_C family probable redox protein